MEDTEITQLLAEICGVGNTVRKVTLKGRERIFSKIQGSNQDDGIKHVLAVFARGYIDGDSKQVVRNRLAMNMHVSEDTADQLCNVSCLEW
jgi:hypothetical protein